MKFTLVCPEWRHTVSHLSGPYLLLDNKNGEMFGGCARKKISRGSRRDQLVSLSEHVNDFRESHGQLRMGIRLVWCSQRLPSILNTGRGAGALPPPSSCRWNLPSSNQKDTCLMTGKHKSGAESEVLKPVPALPAGGYSLSFVRERNQNARRTCKGQNFRITATLYCHQVINDCLPHSLFFFYFILRGLVMSQGMPGTFFLMYEHKLHITT